MLEVVLCDDNQKLVRTYSDMIERVAKADKLSICIKYVASSASEMEDFLSRDSANCFILDIDLKDSRTGYDLARLIREKFPKSYIIFLTCHLEYVFQSFKVKPFNFLAKPVTMEMLENVINDVYIDYIENFDEKPQGYLTVRSSGTLYRIKISDIIYIERVGTKSVVHTSTGEICCNSTLGELYDMIKHPEFFRCHKSFICNKNQISELRLPKNEIVMKDGSVCFVSRSGKKELKENE